MGPANSRAATVQKIVTEILQSEPGMTFAKDSRDLLIECCVEFITLISSEANEIAEKDAKKTIACEHVKQALEELDFHDYVPAILEVAADYKKQQQVRAYTTKLQREDDLKTKLPRRRQNTTACKFSAAAAHATSSALLTWRRTARRNRQRSSKAA